MTAVIWIDWYAYHLSRFRALTEHSELKGKVAGIELVGGCGVHTGLKFRDNDRSGLPICSLLPQEDWAEAGQWRLARILWTQAESAQAFHGLGARLLHPSRYRRCRLGASSRKTLRTYERDDAL